VTLGKEESLGSVVVLRARHSFLCGGQRLGQRGEFAQKQGSDQVVSGGEVAVHGRGSHAKFSGDCSQGNVARAADSQLSMCRIKNFGNHFGSDPFSRGQSALCFVHFPIMAQMLLNVSGVLICEQRSENRAALDMKGGGL
jgi:hypothetical protein